MRVLICLAALLITQSIFAQSTASNISQKESESFLQNLKDSPWGFRLDTESISQRKDNTNPKNVSHFQNNLYPTMSYSVNANNLLYLYPTFIYTKADGHGQEAGNGHYQLLDDSVAFRYDKIGILNQPQHGVDFSLSSRYYTIISNKAKQRNEYYGKFNPRLYFTKKFTDRFTLESENRFYFYLTDWKYGNNKSLDYQHVFYLTPIYQLTNRLSSYMEIRQITQVGKRQGSSDDLRLKPGLDFSVTDKLTLGTSFLSTIIKSKDHDHRTIARTNLQNELSAVYDLNENAKVYFFLTSDLWTQNRGFNKIRQTYGDKFEFEMDLLLKAF